MNTKKYECNCAICILFEYKQEDYNDNKTKYKKELERIYTLIEQNIATEFNNLLYHLQNDDYGNLEGRAYTRCRCRKDGELYKKGRKQYNKELKKTKEYYEKITSDLYKISVFEPHDVGGGDIVEF